MAEVPEFKVILASASTGVLYGELAPKNLDATMYISDVGYINFECDLHHALCHKDFLEPYATDWILMHKEHHIMGGIITGVQINLDNDWVSVSGQDYAHYLDKRIWPFNPNNPTANIYAAINVDMFTVVDELLSTTLAQSDSLDLMWNIGSSGTAINYRIEPGDTETILEKIRDLAEQDPGFDWKMHVDIQNGQIVAEFMAESPQMGEERDYVFQQGKNIGQLGYVENGITATDVYAFGAGTSTKVASSASNLSLRSKYRRLDHTIDVGDIIDKAVVKRQATAELEKTRKSTKGDLTAVVIPEEGFDIWAEIFVGDTVRVSGSTDYEEIDDMYRVISFQIQPTDTGDEQVAVVFENAT